MLHDKGQGRQPVSYQQHHFVCLSSHSCDSQYGGSCLFGKNKHHELSFALVLPLLTGPHKISHLHKVLFGKLIQVREENFTIKGESRILSASST